VRAAPEGEIEDWYFANTPKGRAAVKQIERGELPAEFRAETGAEVTRPNIFVLYEQNIGLLQPLIADELRQAERDYPAGWIEEAFRVAADANVRRWSYVRAVLERWSTEGRGDGTSQRDSDTDRRRYIEGKYADYIEY
jgi:DnaD/phage-associated family protein